MHLSCNAEFHSAVSQVSNLQSFRPIQAGAELANVLPIANRRYGRLQVCATTGRCRRQSEVALTGCALAASHSEWTDRIGGPIMAPESRASIGYAWKNFCRHIELVGSRFHCRLVSENVTGVGTIAVLCRAFQPGRAQFKLLWDSSSEDGETVVRTNAIGLSL